MEHLVVNPSKARLDICTACQLKCVLCPTEANNGRAFLGSGMMGPDVFTEFLEQNPQIRIVELASAGEALLNPDLPEILKSAHDRGVTTSLGGGVNMNDASDESLEALVRYGTARIRFSVDGVTEETYRKYRVGGSLNKVLANIQRINYFKKKHNSELPELLLQFIIFGHNEHELEKVFVLSRMLNAKIFIKLNRWFEQLAVKDRQRIRSMCGYADRAEFLDATGVQYCRDLCLGIWSAPQVNWDGRLLGCGCNTISAFAEYALGNNFTREINNERMRYARRMLMGSAPPRDDIACSHCPFYKPIAEHGLWYTAGEITAAMSSPSMCEG